MNDPLNPQLYDLLVRQFGDVRISNPGQERRVQYSPDPRHPGKLKTKALQHGEQYAINCPFCGEDRHRLYISYQYGRPDSHTQSRNDNLWYCQNNERCHEKSINRMTLQNKLKIPFPRQASGHSSQASAITPAVSPLPQADPTVLPEELIPIHELPPSHPAVAYLLERNFDPEQLWADRRIYFCSYSLNCRPLATNRLVIPIFHLPPSPVVLEKAEPQAVFVGWQARAIPELTLGYEGAPKYLTAAGLKKGELLYGLPQAVNTPGPVFICEGAADVWRVGPQAVGLFGNSMTDQQKRLLLQYFPGRPLIVLLDADAQHEAQIILESLRAARHHAQGNNRVVSAELPPGRKDPGDCTREEIFEAAQKALKQHGKEEQTRIYHNALSARHVEMQQDLPMPIHFEDLSIAAHLLDENAPYDLQSLIKRFLPDNSPAITSNPANPQLTQALNKTLLIRRLWDQGHIAEQLEKQDLEFLYREIELPVLAPLSAMMQHGVLFDVPKLEAHREHHSQQIDNIMKHISITGRIHSQLDPLRSRTGRIQSSKPNLQGIPVALRDAVVAEDKHVLLAADLSQFELRVMAHFAQEPEFLEVYRHGSGDLHLYTASRLFDIPVEEITEEQRKVGKTVNFSLINGQTAKGLADELGIEIPDAVLFLNDFLDRYPQVAMWIDHSIQIAQQQGYVTSLYGRRRHLPDLNAENPQKAFRAERQVVSGIIQATGADIFKWMLGRLYKKLPPEFKMVLPIHDAILFEIPENRMEEAKQLIREIMQESPPKFTIPLVANIHVGKSWRECQG